MIDAPATIPELEPTMPQDTDLDATLISLRDSLGDLSTLVNIVLGLRRNADRLTLPLASVLVEVRDEINHTLTILGGRP
jgi:hypothetical protein